MPSNKVKLTQQEFDDFYEIDKPEEKTFHEKYKPETTSALPAVPLSEDKEEEEINKQILNEEQENQDEELFADLPSMEEVE